MHRGAEWGEGWAQKDSLLPENHLVKLSLSDNLMPSDMTRLRAVIFSDGGSDTLWYRSIWGPAGSIDSGSRSHVDCFHVSALFMSILFMMSDIFDRYPWWWLAQSKFRSHQHPNWTAFLCFSLREGGRGAISFPYFNKGSLENQIRRNFVTFLQYLSFKRLEAKSDNCGFIQIEKNYFSIQAMHWWIERDVTKYFTKNLINHHSSSLSSHQQLTICKHA